MRSRRVNSRHGNGHGPADSFNLGWLINLGGIPFLTVAFAGVGWYFITGDTVRRHGAEIKEIIASREDERKQRETARTEFFNSQTKLTEVLGKLETRLAVSEAQQKVTADQIGKLVDSVQRISVPSRAR